MPLLANLVSTDAVRDHATTPTVPVPRPARTSRHRRHLPARRSRSAWVISIVLHLGLGLWIAAAVRTMLAESRTPEEPGFTIRCLPVIPLPDAPVEREPDTRVTIAIPEPEPASITLPPIEAPADTPAEPDYVTAFIRPQTGIPSASPRQAASHLFRQPLRPGPPATAPASASASGEEAPLQDAVPVALPATPAEPVPFVIDGPEPVYPPISLRDGHQGKVVLAVTLNGDGSVATIQVISSSGHRVLDAAALQAVRRWRFNPGGDGRHTTVRVVFLTT